MSTIQLNVHEFETLKKKAQCYDKLNLQESLGFSKNITSNAINVNKASKTRLSEIQNIESLVNEFIEYSNSINSMSTHSLESSKVASSESSEIIELINELFILINQMSDSIKEFSKLIEALNIKNDSITELVQVNGKISMQTNLLAINAAIEASKAKEYGRGFSIVASEVKKLAAASKKSTNDIGSEVHTMTNMTSEVIQKNEAVQKLVDNSVEVSKSAIDKLKRLIEVAQQNSIDSNEISSNVNQQLQSSDTIKNNISKLISDTKLAIEGSSKNITLGRTLVSNLEQKCLIR